MRDINNNYSTLFLGLKANFFCTNRTIGVTSFSISINHAIGTTGTSELMNRICFCVLDIKKTMIHISVVS